MVGKSDRGLSRQITSLVLISKFQTDWFQVRFLGRTEIASKSRFVLRASNVTCCFFNRNFFSLIVLNFTILCPDKVSLPLSFFLGMLWTLSIWNFYSFINSENCFFIVPSITSSSQFWLYFFPSRVIRMFHLCFSPTYHLTLKFSVYLSYSDSFCNFPGGWG